MHLLLEPIHIHMLSLLDLPGLHPSTPCPFLRVFSQTSLQRWMVQISNSAHLTDTIGEDDSVCIQCGEQGFGGICKNCEAELSQVADAFTTEEGYEANEKADTPCYICGSESKYRVCDPCRDAIAAMPDGSSESGSD